MKNIFVWTHHDLDGLASCLMVKWAHPEYNFNYITSNGYNFRSDFTKWLLKNKLSDYDKVFIVDLDISEHQDLIDTSNVYIIDHHHTHVENATYEFATNVIVEYTSAAMLCYKTFKTWYGTNISNEQKLLIILADDYDSYNHNLKDSQVLNAIFWATQNNFNVFMERYEAGFDGFTDQQLALYRNYCNDLREVLTNLEYYEGKKIAIGKTPQHVIATFATKFINNVADHILENYNPDIVMIVNPNTKHVSLRRNDDSKVNVGRLAEALIDGGGHSYAAGGIITDNFLQFTQLLKPRKKLKKIK